MQLSIVYRKVLEMERVSKMRIESRYIPLVGSSCVHSVAASTSRRNIRRRFDLEGFQNVWTNRGLAFSFGNLVLPTADPGTRHSFMQMRAIQSIP